MPRGVRPATRRRPGGRTKSAGHRCEIEASAGPAREGILYGRAILLVRVQIVDLDNADPVAHAFIDLRSTCARRLAFEILAAADDADWQTQQDGCPQPAR